MGDVTLLSSVKTLFISELIGNGFDKNPEGLCAKRESMEVDEVVCRQLWAFTFFFLTPGLLHLQLSYVVMLSHQFAREFVLYMHLLHLLHLLHSHALLGAGAPGRTVSCLGAEEGEGAGGNADIGKHWNFQAKHFVQMPCKNSSSN